jgi:heterodisulfide reductase subunit A
MAKGEDCTLCREACIVEGAINYEDREDMLELEVGSIAIATGAGLYDLSRIPNLGYGSVPGVFSSFEFERMLSANGPTGGKLESPEGEEPKSVCIVQCAGSLDPDHKEYCSGICCQEAFKLNEMIGKQSEGAKVYHLYKEMVTPGKQEISLYRRVKDNPNSEFVRYEGIGDINVSKGTKGVTVSIGGASAPERKLDVDMVVLCPAVVPTEKAAGLAETLGLELGPNGFFEEFHSTLDSARSKVKGIYLAGTCRSPMGIEHAMGQGMASAGYVLAGLTPGKKLEVKPICATVLEDKCGGCMICASVCPYKAISFDSETGKAYVNAVLCYGCGTCVAACPAKAIRGNHFTSAQIAAEIEGVLG